MTLSHSLLSAVLHPLPLCFLIAPKAELALRDLFDALVAPYRAALRAVSNNLSSGVNWTVHIARYGAGNPF